MLSFKKTPGSLKRPFFIVLLLYFSLASQWVYSAEQKATQAQLSKLKNNISQLQKKLKKDRSTRSTEEKALIDAEKQIGDVNRRIYQLDQQLLSLKTDLSGYQDEKARLEKEIEQSKDSLNALIRQQYRVGQNPRIFMLLNQRDPDQLSRMMKYYDRFSDAQLKQLKSYRELLVNLSDTHVAIDSTEQEILTNREHLQDKAKELDSLRKKRKASLAKLKKQISSNQSKLKRYQNDKKRLEKLLVDIEKSVSLADLTQNNQSFRSLKGKLKWPVNGKVKRGFGTRRDNITFDGMLISGKVGSNVKAIHHGRIVFSDWLRGYGLLSIVDHGDGYMSLYGHNDSLLKEPGEWVSQGETIATVGNSGGNNEPGLYFAIRYKGKSTNPKRWLSRR